MYFTIGAYAASPSGFVHFNKELETEYYAALRDLQNVGGLEIPFYGETLHRDDTSWFLTQLKPEWDHVLTGIPGIMAILNSDPHFGIASDDAGGRARAVAYLEKARWAVFTLNRFVKRQAVKQVFVHTAPQLGKPGVSSSKAALAESLATLGAWDWDGADLVIEHCDAFVASHKPAKGFLNLEEEIAAIKNANSKKLGIAVNWGRSVIETRCADGALAHIQLAKHHGLLKALMFSGVTVDNPLFGAWSDSHVPFAKDFGNEFGVADSLMTAGEVSRSLKAACAGDTPDVIGFKIQVLPETATIQERIGYLRDGITLLDKL